MCFCGLWNSEIKIWAENSGIHLFWQDKRLWGEEVGLPRSIKYPGSVSSGNLRVKWNTCPLRSVFLRKWFQCFHPGNGCNSPATAAISHYPTKGSNFCGLSKNAQNPSWHQPFPPRIWGFAVCPREGLQSEHGSSSWFWELFFFKGKISFWKPQMWRDSLAPAERTIGCLIITPRIHFATPRMSWSGVDLLKLGFFEGICLPGALFATTPEGSSGVCPWDGS